MSKGFGAASTGEFFCPPFEWTPTGPRRRMKLSCPTSHHPASHYSKTNDVSQKIFVRAMASMPPSGAFITFGLYIFHCTPTKEMVHCSASLAQTRPATSPGTAARHGGDMTTGSVSSGGGWAGAMAPKRCAEMSFPPQDIPLFYAYLHDGAHLPQE